MVRLLQVNITKRSQFYVQVYHKPKQYQCFYTRGTIEIVRKQLKYHTFTFVQQQVCTVFTTVLVHTKRVQAALQLKRLTGVFSPLRSGRLKPGSGPDGICGEQSGSGTDFAPNTFLSRCQNYHFASSPYSMDSEPTENRS